MNRTLRGTGRVALLAAIVSGCSPLTDPLEGRLGSRLPSDDFSAWLVGPGQAAAPDLEVRGGAGRIEVQGSVDTPVPCYLLTGHADVLDHQIEFTVVALYQGEVCTTVTALFGYEAVIRDLAPGTYTVRLTHRVNGTQNDILETEVVVE